MSENKKYSYMAFYDGTFYKTLVRDDTNPRKIKTKKQALEKTAKAIEKIIKNVPEKMNELRNQIRLLNEDKKERLQQVKHLKKLIKKYSKGNENE